MSAKEDAKAIAKSIENNISSAMASAAKLQSLYESDYLGPSVRDAALIRRLMKEKAERGLRG